MRRVFLNNVTVILLGFIVCFSATTLELSCNNSVYAALTSDEQREPYSDDRPVILPQVPEVPPPQEVKSTKLPKGKLALTFDDGPHPTYTPQILDLLKKNKAKATFFFIGTQADAYPEIVQRAVTEGHEIGTHTQWHASVTSVGYWSAYKDTEEGFQTLVNVTGKQPTLFRSPYGEWSRAYFDACQEFEMTPVWWDIDSQDWQRRGAEHIANLILSQSAPGDIVLMHDGGGDRCQTVTALAIVLKSFQEKEWSSVTLSELNQQ